MGPGLSTRGLQRHQRQPDRNTKARHQHRDQLKHLSHHSFPGLRHCSQATWCQLAFWKTGEGVDLLGMLFAWVFPHMLFFYFFYFFFFFFAPTTCSLSIRQKENKHSNLELPNFYIPGSKLQWPAISFPVSEWKKKISKAKNIVVELEIS